MSVSTPFGALSNALGRLTICGDFGPPCDSSLRRTADNFIVEREAFLCSDQSTGWWVDKEGQVHSSLSTEPPKMGEV